MPAAIAAAPAEERHLYWIDWVRFLAAFAVVAQHARVYNWQTGYDFHDSTHPFFRSLFYSVGTAGEQAVVIFFVLSGWLVGGRALQKFRAGTFDAASYAADRVARVYVPLIPALLLAAAAGRAVDASSNPRQLGACLFGLQGIHGEVPGENAPLWTLAYEMWFYVLAGCLPVLCRRGSTRTQRVLAGAGALLAVAQCSQLRWTGVACWLLGVAGPWVRERVPSSGRGKLVVASGLTLVLATLAFQFKMSILPWVVPLEWLPPPAFAQFIVGISALMLIACLVDLPPKTRVGRRLERIGTPLAAFSYTLYLTHYPLVWSLAKWEKPMPVTLDGPSTLRYGVWIVLCLGLALVMHALFERQTPRVRRWLRARFAAASFASHPSTLNRDRLLPAGREPLAGSEPA